MKLLLGIALLFFVYAARSAGTIDYEIVGCFDATNRSDSSSPVYLLQLKEVNETCFQVEQRFANGTETINYIAPARDGGVQIEIPVETCSIDLPAIHLSLCDEHDGQELQFNLTDFSTQSYFAFDSSEEDSANRTSADDQSKESPEDDLHWMHFDNATTDSTDTTADFTTDTTITTTTTTTTTTKATAKKGPPKAKATGTTPKGTTTTTSADVDVDAETTTTTSSAVPPKKAPAKSKGKTPK